MELRSEFKLNGCTAKCQEGAIVVASDRDATDRLVLTAADADAAARIFRSGFPGLAGALSELARTVRFTRMNDRRSVEE
jgi:hypothetical protein